MAANLRKEKRITKAIIKIDRAFDKSLHKSAKTNNQKAKITKPSAIKKAVTKPVKKTVKAKKVKALKV